MIANSLLCFIADQHGILTLSLRNCTINWHLPDLCSLESEIKKLGHTDRHTNIYMMSTNSLYTLFFTIFSSL